ncbi:serine/threonine-protein kinase 19-like isoform X2 [Chenopodium quinoa]|uniref:serine/threonine-protein kinase 19-like isoform X2 n=1 Tax=Chenopodium quinoa TaxID=63459 RepID=UPI000B7820C1|nr:serine/threonine-protein kinase 19-like isoform X2 [Chenopodium quinoa]
MEDKTGPSSSSSNADKKRKRVTDFDSDSQLNDDHDELLSFEKSLTFSDTLVALRMMQAQFPKLEKVTVKPFILHSQLYSSVKDRTQVDQELELLKRDKVLRVFKLNTGQDDHAIMFLEDYIQQYSLLSAGGKMKDEYISLLVNAGIITRQLIDPNVYWFAIPNIGSILKGISQGRKELLSFLNRRKYKEMMLALLEKKRLRFSPLDMRFHLRDLIGSGHLQTCQTPTGIVVRVLKD